jgi:hypothetical protein
VPHWGEGTSSARFAMKNAKQLHLKPGPNVEVGLTFDQNLRRARIPLRQLADDLRPLEAG